MNVHFRRWSFTVYAETGIVMNCAAPRKAFLYFEDKDDLALYFLQLRLKEWLEENKATYSTPIDIIIDEGRQKAGSCRDSILSSKIVTKNKIRYRRSSDEPLLQVADFIAFCHNRTQWILGKEERNKSDILFMDIFREASFNIINLPKIRINEINDFTRDDFDYFHFQDKTEKNLMTRSEVELMKRKIGEAKSNK